MCTVDRELFLFYCFLVCICFRFFSRRDGKHSLMMIMAQDNKFGGLGPIFTGVGV